MSIAAIALLAACDLEGGPSIADKAVADIQLRGTDEAELRNLYNELAARLNARGVTPAEAEATAATGDEEAVRRLFGYSPEELAEVTARFVALGQRVERTYGGSGGHDPPGGDPDRPPPQNDRVRCNNAAIGVCFTGGVVRFWRYGNVGLALIAVWGLGCTVAGCHIEGGGWVQVP